MGDSVYFYELISRSVSAHQLNVIAWAFEMIGQESQESFIRCGVDGWGRHLDPKLIAGRFTDLVQGSAGLQLNAQQHAIRLCFQERSHSEINGSRARIPGLE
jgi:hypothetical protein